ncbi:MAG: hypothetical protein MN733_23655 [Nitrososphaera sp.]|nr:hypothetical protein [Nitrososphaera sp.]
MLLDDNSKRFVDIVSANIFPSRIYAVPLKYPLRLRSPNDIGLAIQCNISLKGGLISKTHGLEIREAGEAADAWWRMVAADTKGSIA